VPKPLWSILSAAERDRANRFRLAQDRTLFAMTRAALRALLGKAIGVSAAQITFDEGPHGKPCLAGLRGPHFNVSHSGSWALIGLSDSRPIGVDIEFMRKLDNQLAVARSFFSDAEYRALIGIENGMRHQAFYNFWTAKEAVLKALGVGISKHLKDFSIELAKERYAVHPEPACSLPALAAATAHPVTVPDGYTGCYALA
jgi:4'-phosphopantetheinyl transferase